MKFLFVAKQPKNAEAFFDTLRQLAESGHEVAVAVQEWDEQRDRVLEQQAGSDRFRVVACPPARIDQWGAIAPVVRRLRDCLHVLQPAFADGAPLQRRIADKLREELALPTTSDALLGALSAVPPAQLGRLESILRLAERAIPTSDLFNEFLRAERPDVVLISPLVHFGSAQADVAASARRLRIPVWMLMFSWDNLSTKGCLHVEPDLMFVWNERQRQEARDLHRFPADRVVVAGAPRFDAFFRLRPLLTRERFHQPLGLDPSQATLLYLCSSRLIAPHEMGFITRWLAAVRSSRSASLRACNVVIRPHPDVALLEQDAAFERQRWSEASDLHAQAARPFASDPRTVVLRTSYKDPLGLFESLVHSTAVVGLNTTAELEAGIVGRPVFTIQTGADADDGPAPTVHFHYLTREHGGFVSVATSMEEHVGQVAASLDRQADPEPIRRFIESFLRPHGIDRPVAPLLAELLAEHASRKTDGTAAQEPEDAVDDAAIDEIDVPAPSADDLIPLSCRGARILVHATPEATRQAANGAVRVDRATVRWLEEWVKIGEVVYDVNAGFGRYALIAARQRGAAVVAFEPGYKAYAQLCDNLLLNACQGAVIPVPCALVDHDGIAHIKYSRGQTGADRYSVQQIRWRIRAADSIQPNVHAVCAMRMDSAAAQYALPPPAHIRLSPYVSAIDVLAGAPRVLASGSLRTMMVQVPPAQEQPVTALLGEAGLRLTAHRVRSTSVQMVFARDSDTRAVEGAAGSPAKGATA